jgi:HTH-type transcriptional regulator/antitoxin HigA
MEMNKRRYLELLEGFPPRVIGTKNQLLATENMIESLLARKDALDQTELAYLDLLSKLVSDWEAEHAPIPELTGVELVRELCGERGVSQRDLVKGGVFATDSVASEVFSGKRGLTVAHIKGLARYFDLPADLFLPTGEMALPA